MSTKLLNVVEWTRPFISNMLLLNDATIEPATTNANILLGTMLGAPFVWEWNRATTTFTCVVATTDYVQVMTDYGFMETAHLTVPMSATQDQGIIYQMTPQRQLEKTSQPGRPGYISTFLDDQAGNITFRVGGSAPEQAYPVVITYQKAPTKFTNISAVVPIPDKLMHIFKYGFLALAFLYAQDDRFAAMNQKFIATLLGSQQGLDATQKNIFLGTWYTMLTDQAGIGLTVQQAVQARGAQ